MQRMLGVGCWVLGVGDVSNGDEGVGYTETRRNEGKVISDKG